MMSIDIVMRLQSIQSHDIDKSSIKLDIRVTKLINVPLANVAALTLAAGTSSGLPKICNRAYGLALDL